MFYSNKNHPWNFSNCDDVSDKKNINFQKFNSENYSNRYQNIDHYYNLENYAKPKNFTCCNKSFYSHNQYKKHVDEHVECPFPECKLSLHLKLIDQHITDQHMLINFEDLQIDNETWKAERKKRFPSLQRATLRRAEQLERIKRGERLGKNSSKFAKSEKGSLKKDSGKADEKEFQSRRNRFDRKDGNFNKERKDGNFNKERKDGNFNKERKDGNFNKERKDGNFNKERKDGNFNKERKDGNFNKERKDKEDRERKIIIERNFDEDSDSEVTLGIPAFKGTKAFYESIGEVSLFGVKSSEEQQREIDISDEEEWDKPIVIADPEKCILQNALGLLMGAYDSDSDAEMHTEPITPVVKIEQNMENPDLKINENIKRETPHESENNGHVKKEEPLQSENVMKNKRKRFRQNRNNGTKASNMPTRKNILDAKFKRNKYRRRTLLEKLLEPQIVHERNVILQCIRYIADNNFFDSQTSEV